jgi:hypothetical protein
MLDYCIEATDTRQWASPIQHVWVGAGGSSGGGGVSWVPTAPTEDNTITITVAGTTAPCKLHWGVNSFGLPIAAYRPAGTVLYNGTGPAVETPMMVSGSDLTITLGPFNDPAQAVTVLDFVLHYDDGTWDNNGGSDWHVSVSGGSSPITYTMDGALDASAELVSSNAGVNLYLDWNGSQLYMASQAASGVGNDVFILVAGSQLALRGAPWAKSGQVADWAAFIGNESGNNWCGWFDQQGATAVSAGSILEGTLDLAGELGSVPAKVYVAGRYGPNEERSPCGARERRRQPDAAVRYVPARLPRCLETMRADSVFACCAQPVRLLRDALLRALRRCAGHPERAGRARPRGSDFGRWP